MPESSRNCSDRWCVKQMCNQQWIFKDTCNFFLNSRLFPSQILINSTPCWAFLLRVVQKLVKAADANTKTYTGQTEEHQSEWWNTIKCLYYAL